MQRLSCVQNGIDMPGNLHPSPLLAKHAVAIDQERTPIDAHIFLAVELLQLDDIEQLAEQFILVADELKGECLLCLKVFMSLEAVPRNTEDQGVGIR